MHICVYLFLFLFEHMSSPSIRDSANVECNALSIDVILVRFPSYVDGKALEE